MGEYWNKEGFKKFRKNIIDTNKEIGKIFRRAYKIFGAAKAVHDDWTNYNNEALNQAKLIKLKEELKEKIFTSSVVGFGAERHIFATAFTPNGNVALTTSNEINNKKFEGNQIYMENYMNAYTLSKYREEMKIDSELFYELFNKVTKKVIDKFEKYEQDYLKEKEG